LAITRWVGESEGQQRRFWQCRLNETTPNTAGLIFSAADTPGMPESFAQILASIASRPKFLPEWPEGQRAMPNEILRSALFNCRNRKQPRSFLKDAEIALIGDGQVIYRGEELRQDDELVWLHLMHLAKKVHLGACIDFTPYSFVKALGWSIKGQSYERLRVCLSRMQATAIRIQSKRLGCFVSVSLIQKFEDHLRKSASPEDIIRIASCLGVKLT